MVWAQKPRSRAEGEIPASVRPHDRKGNPILVLSPDMVGQIVDRLGPGNGGKEKNAGGAEIIVQVSELLDRIRQPERAAICIPGRGPGHIGSHPFVRFGELSQQLDVIRRVRGEAEKLVGGGGEGHGQRKGIQPQEGNDNKVVQESVIIEAIEKNKKKKALPAMMTAGSENGTRMFRGPRGIRFFHTEIIPPRSGHSASHYRPDESEELR